MSKTYEEIGPELAEWIQAQKMFVVSTAPLAGDGLLNCSPKGMDSFRVLGPKEVAYIDLTGSGVETIAHLRENGRIIVMFCSYEGPPKIVRLNGIGETLLRDSDQYNAIKDRFPDLPGARAIIRIRLTRISDSCGYSVPKYEFKGERDTLIRWAESKGVDGVEAYRQQHNVKSLDGLPGIDLS